MTYNKLTETCFFDARHAGRLTEGAPYLAHYRSGRPGFGDVLDIYLACDETGRVVAARFQACGNPWLIAACEWVCARFETEGLVGMDRMGYQELIAHFEIPHARYPVALQVEDACRAIITEIRDKMEKK